MTQADPEPTPSQQLFRAWLESGTSTGSAAFERWCAQNQEHESELRTLYAAWLVLAPTLGPKTLRGSLDARLVSKFGSEAVPRVDLRAEGKPNTESQAGSAEVLSRLSSRGPVSTRYSVKGEVARGGMGAILRVWDEDLRRFLAMKVILGTGEAIETGDTPPPDPKMLSRFLEEAQVTGQLDHPGIVPVHELGLDPSGRVFFTMKLVRGKTLGEVFGELAGGKGGWTRERVLSMLIKVCEAMAYAHDRGVIHRDLKPANIMVGKYGEVYVMDWGLARVQGHRNERDIRLTRDSMDALVGVRSDRRDEAAESSDSALYTMDGDIVGTPAYMPPEQAMGDVKGLGPHSDLYAVGAMLYHLLAGEAPYCDGDGATSPLAVLARLHEGPPTRLRELDPSVSEVLERICEKAMSRDSSDRYADMGSLGESLHAVVYRRTPKLSRKSWVTLRSGERVVNLFILVLVIIGLFLPFVRQVEEPRALTLSLSYASFSLWLLGLFEMRTVLRSMRTARHFDPKNEHRTRRMAIYVLSYCVMNFVGRHVKYVWLGEGGFRVEAVEMVALLGWFLLMILAEAFKYGAELQEQKEP